MNTPLKIRRLSQIILICCATIFMVSCGDKNTSEPEGKNSVPEQSMPYYFYAIHIEPYNRPTQRAEIDEHYPIVKQMIAKADKYNIKLTLMFAASWVDYILESPERTAELAAWKRSGHEIAMHHHSITHGMRRPGFALEDWDGYSFMPKEKAIAFRGKLRAQLGKEPEPYQGDLNDLTDKLKRINPDIHSGCANIGASRKSLPDAIIYDTCSQIAFYEGEVKTIFPFALDAEGGRNDYVTVGTYNGIERKFLTHFYMNPYLAGMGGETSSEVARKVTTRAANVFRSMKSGVFGTVNHGEVNEFEVFSMHLDFLHSVDPEGKMSRTLTEIMEQNLLPEKRIPDELMNRDAKWAGY